jgi:hypothetical protein
MQPKYIKIPIAKKDFDFNTYWESMTRAAFDQFITAGGDGLKTAIHLIISTTLNKARNGDVWRH